MKHQVLLQSGRLFLLIFNKVCRSSIIFNDMHPILLPKNSWYINEQNILADDGSVKLHKYN